MQSRLRSAFAALVAALTLLGATAFARTVDPVVWVKAEGNASDAITDGNHGVVNVTKRSATGAGDAWQVGIAYSGGNFILQFVGNTSGGLFDWYSGALTSSVGARTHVAVTCDGSTVKGCINGILVLMQAVTLQLSSRTADIYAGTALPHDTKLDERSIYNCAHFLLLQS